MNTQLHINGGDPRVYIIGLLALVLTFLAFNGCHAQGRGSNQNHLQVGVGALYERGFDLTIAYEHETKYHSAWEYFVSGYIKYDEDPVAGHITKESFWNNYQSWFVGIAYKPCVVRGRNHHGNLRLGVMCGSNTHDIIGGGTVGYQHNYALKGGWQIFWQVKTEFVLRGEDLFRTGVCLGLKAPL